MRWTRTRSALQTDPTSAFGGIIAFNREVDGAAAEAVAKQFVEVLIAPSFSAEAQQVFAAKQNVRLLQIPLANEVNAFDFKRVGGGLLVQAPDAQNLAARMLNVVSKKQPTPQQLQDLMFAWRVAKFVKSNAIVFCGNGMTLGVGAGQMSRVDSARIASIKAQNAGLSLAGSAVASDAFFPFRDGLDVVVRRRRDLRDPAGRLDARPGSDRCGRRAGRGDAVYRHAPFPPLSILPWATAFFGRALVRN